MEIFIFPNKLLVLNDGQTVIAFVACHRLEALHLVVPYGPGLATPLDATTGDRTEVKSGKILNITLRSQQVFIRKQISVRLK